jgi:homoserine O-succinyltransferase
MSFLEKNKIRIAILDLYEGQANQGMRCIREILNQFGEANDQDISWDEFDVRQHKQVPDLSYDIFISSGGPGSPLDSEQYNNGTTVKPTFKKNMFSLSAILFS